VHLNPSLHPEPPNMYFLVDCRDSNVVAKYMMLVLGCGGGFWCCVLCGLGGWLELGRIR
jgi:hypothetical protein